MLESTFRKLRAAYRAALELAHAQGFQPMAFLFISTGIFDFPVARGAAEFTKRAVSGPER